MAKRVNFFDGATSATSPLFGSIDVSNLSTYADDAAFEAVNGVGEEGDIYANTTDNVIRYHNGTAWTTVILSNVVGQANGVASLDGSGKVPTSQIPALAISEVFVVADEAAMIALTAEEGDVAKRLDLGESFIHNGGVAGDATDWTRIHDDVFSSPLTTDGDIMVYSSGETRLGVGSEGQILTVSSGLPSWQNAPATGNFWSDPVDSAIIPDSPDAYNIGSGANPFSRIYAKTIILDDATEETYIRIFGTNNTFAEFGTQGSNVPTDAPTDFAHIRTNTASDFAIYTENSSGAGPSKDIFVGTGDNSSTGDSGNITIKTGTVTSGVRGKITMKDGSEGNPGYVWTEGATAGEGSWQAPTAAYTDEEAQDAVGTILTDSSTIDFTYDDITPSITASVIFNDAGSGTADVWSASKISSELSGKADTAHTHAASDVTSGTFADARISQSSVTQHQAALTITESQISDLTHYVSPLTTNGDINIYSGGDTRLPIGAEGEVLTVSSGLPVWAAPTGSTDTKQSLVSANDTTEGYLENKVIGAFGVAMTTLNDGGNEQLRATLDIGGLGTATLLGTDELAFYDISAGTPRKTTAQAIADLAASDTKQSLVSSNDTTEGYLEDKIIGAFGVAMTTLNDGGNEQLRATIDINSLGTATLLGTDELVFYDVSAGTPRKTTAQAIADLTPAGDLWSDAVDSDIVPTGAGSTYDLGTSADRFAQSYIDDMKISDVGALRKGVSAGGTAQSLDFTSTPINSDAKVILPYDAPTIGQTDNISAFIWFKQNGLPSGGSPVLMGHGDTTPRKWYVYMVPGTGKLQIFIGDAGSTVRQWETNAVVSDNVWHHFGFSVAGSTLRLFLDGVELTQNNGSGDPTTYTSITNQPWGGGLDSSVEPINIGNLHSFSINWEGHVDEFTYWDTAFDATAASELYNSNAWYDASTHTNSANLKVWYSMTDDVGSTVVNQINPGTGDGTVSGATPPVFDAVELIAGDTGGAANNITLESTNNEDMNINAGTGSITFTSDSWGIHGVSAPQSAAYTPTNDVEDRSFDADATSTAELADVLATLIKDLQAKGIIG